MPFTTFNILQYDLIKYAKEKLVLNLKSYMIYNMYTYMYTLKLTNTDSPDNRTNFMNTWF